MVRWVSRMKVMATKWQEAVVGVPLWILSKTQAEDARLDSLAVYTI